MIGAEPVDEPAIPATGVFGANPTAVCKGLDVRAGLAHVSGLHRQQLDDRVTIERRLDQADDFVSSTGVWLPIL